MCEHFTDAKKLCTRLDISRQTLRRLIRRGELACYRVGGSVKFTEADVTDFLRRCRVDPVQRASLSNNHADRQP